MHTQKCHCQSRLSSLSPGQSACIEHIDQDSAISRRMEDMGLHAGVCIRCERISFLGDPGAYRIGDTGTVVALRRTDAQAVHIREDGHSPWA